MDLNLNTFTNDADNNDRPLFNRDFILITLSSFVFFFNFHSFILLPVRIEELGGSEAKIGFIMGMAALATIITTPTVGIAIDRFGKKWFFVAGVGLVTVITFVFVFAGPLNVELSVLRVSLRHILCC